MSIAVSFVIMIVALAIAGGFRREIRSGLATLSGDIYISSASRVAPLSAMGDGIPSGGGPLDSLSAIDGVESVRAVIYEGGIVRSGDDIYGVIFKGVESGDSAGLKVVVPRHFATRASLQEGSEMLTYFVGEKVSVRKFVVSELYDSIVTGDDKVVIFCDIHTLRRVLGWGGDTVSALELRLSPGADDVLVSAEVSSLLYNSDEDFAGDLCCSRTSAAYSTFFDWLTLVDFNMTVVLILMIVVAGFNMVGGLLILLFENISTIGLLKSMGMTDRKIAKTFLMTASRQILLAMLIGNAVAVCLCLLQDSFHPLTLNPANYFISFVPVALSPAGILTVDILAFLVIMLVLLIPCGFVSKVDPSRTISFR